MKAQLQKRGGKRPNSLPMSHVGLVIQEIPNSVDPCAVSATNDMTTSYSPFPLKFFFLHLFSNCSKLPSSELIEISHLFVVLHHFIFLVIQPPSRDSQIRIPWQPLTMLFNIVLRSVFIKTRPWEAEGCNAISSLLYKCDDAVYTELY